MVKKVRMAILFLVIYAFLFWIGFRSGEVYNRTKNKVQVEKIIVKETPPDKLFYVLEERDYGTYKCVEFNEFYENQIIMKFFFNKKLRPLLKLRKLKIYNSKGDRIY